MIKTKEMLILILFLGTTSVYAQNLFNFSAGFVWPREDEYIHPSHNDGTAWNAAFEAGRVFSEKITIGAKIDFLWHIETNRATENGISVIVSKSRLFMFPVSAFLQIDPLAQFMFHPVARVQVGYNSLVLSYKDDKDKEKTDPQDGYYNGIITKFGIDGLIDIGKHASIFAGFEYQIAPTERRGSKSATEMNMSAPAFRFGVSVLY